MALKELKQANLLPTLIVTNPDRPQGRGQKKQPTTVAKWAKKHKIKTIKPKKIDEETIQLIDELGPTGGWPVFVVVAYGKILPSELIYLPTQNSINLHPSLLPKLRGPAPIRGAILNEDETGVTIMELDEKMDHGPIIAQEKVKVDEWPPYYPKLKKVLAESGGKLLAEVLPQWVAGDIKAVPQDHDQATYIEKFSSADGEVNLNDKPEVNLRKIRAFTDWPKAHFFSHTTDQKQEDKRVIITAAHIKDGKLVIEKVKPEGESVMNYQKFLNRETTE